MAAARSVRFIAPDPVPLELIENAIRCASQAPSGANQQPWKFVVVKDPEIKRQIRAAAEAEERESYEHRMPAEWLEALAPLGTDWRKEFLPFVLLPVGLPARTRPERKLLWTCSKSSNRGWDQRPASGCPQTPRVRERGALAAWRRKSQAVGQQDH